MDSTPWNPDWLAAIQRVTELVENVFACRVKFQTLDSFFTESKSARLFLEQDLVFLDSAFFEPPKMIRGTLAGSFAFPIRIRRAGANAHDISLVGIASIEGLAASDDERLMMLGEFLHMAVESRLNAFERLLDVEQRERAVFDQSKIRENNKVVRLFPRHAIEVESDEAVILRSYENELLLEKPVLIVARGAVAQLPFSRLALEIFNRTSLWFFVNIADLSDDAFQSAQSFRDLGRMCIFIPDLAEVSIEKQLRLAEVFSSPADAIDAPRLIAMAHEAPETLVGKGTLLPHLLTLLHTFELDPAIVRSGELSHQSLRGIVHSLETHMSNMSKPTNLISFVGRLRQDDNSNPTFH